MLFFQEGQPQTAAAAAARAVAAAMAAATTAAVVAVAAAGSTRDRKVEFKMLYQVDDEHAAVKTDNSNGRRGPRVRFGLQVIHLWVRLLTQLVRAPVFYSLLEEGAEEKGQGGVDVGGTLAHSSGACNRSEGAAVVFLGTQVGACSFRLNSCISRRGQPTDLLIPFDNCRLPCYVLGLHQQLTRARLIRGNRRRTRRQTVKSR